MSKELMQEKWYEDLIDDCQTIITEAVFVSRWTLVQGYHQLGKRILKEHNNFQRAKIYGQEIVQRVAQSLGKSERTIFQVIQFVKKYPILDDVPEGKNISWHKICNNLLPQSKQKTLDFPPSTYSVILADPPWQFANAGLEQSAEQQYSTMPTNKICELPVNNLAIKASVLFLWATNAMLEDALKVCKAWGFNYKSNLVWIKDRGPSIGWFTISRHELLLIATKEDNTHPREKYLSWFKGEVTKHSKKPEVVYDIIESMYDGPYIELFARGKIKRNNWTYWGNEVSED